MPCWDSPPWSPAGSAKGQVNERIQAYQAEEKRLDDAAKVGQVIYDTFNQVSAENSVGGLEKSMWASDHHVYSLPLPVLNQGKNKQKEEDNNEQTAVKNNIDNPKGDSGKAKMEQKKAERVTINLDDTEAFMDALERIRKAGKAKANQDPKSAPTGDKENCHPAGEPGPSTTTQPEFKDTKCHPAKDEELAPEEEEDREHLVTFKTWGTPIERPATTSARRRVILTGIPIFLRGQSRLLSLIHGGKVESIAVHPASQSAEVRFCDATACKAFYDKYPNGIDVDYNGSRGTVFVDIGKEVDIVSSRLMEFLDIGATRVVRAVGAPLDVSIAQLVEIIDSKKWHLEKIIDSYEASAKIRTVVFRFCSMDAAVRFRSYLIRMDNWDQANVQFGPDPCEAATSIHWD
ncbi:hypothetical protein FQN49_001433 [Arthroderma sp. PD_2]|nr:hypothetical protein FQN49_001433 [Arthroderma sp. PD_2]